MSKAVDDKVKQIEEDFAETCHKLGGKFHMTELVGGADMFCHLKGMDIKYRYMPKDISTVSISSNKKTINDIPETEIEIGEPNIVDYDDDKNGLVIRSKEMYAFVSKYGHIHVVDAHLSDYREMAEQY
ncbi:MAG: hypothetical protein DRN17_06150 [Thermoplasmata archaeon]|nr:MAG: hypothetical protein DRN17_06150 [Thermoplasmata archaeon]